MSVLAEKRGGELRRVSLDDELLVVEDQAEALLDLEAALTRLAELDGRLARVVECRFFGGLTEDETAEALGLIRAAGLIAAVISNSNGSVRAILDGLGLGAYLDFVLDSSEVGVEKPDPRIFRLALERSGLGPGQAIYVGDLYSVDVLGARAAGLAAFLLDPGACWGPRDCPTAPDVLTAVQRILDEAGP